MNFRIYHYTRIQPGGPWFTCQGATLPELKIERPIRTDIASRCAFILRGHIVDGSYTVFTGLLRTKWDQIFTGDLILPAGKSFVIATMDGENLTLAVAENFRVFPRSRVKGVTDYLKQNPRAI